MAGRIPEQFIDDLLARVDIVDVIDELVRRDPPDDDEGERGEPRRAA